MWFVQRRRKMNYKDKPQSRHKFPRDAGCVIRKRRGDDINGDRGSTNYHKTIFYRDMLRAATDNFISLL